MIQLHPGVRVYLACGYTDMRRGFDGLAMQVQEVLKEDPFCGALFAFRGRRGQHTTFYIQFTIGEDCLPLAPAVWSGVASVAVPAR